MMSRVKQIGCGVLVLCFVTAGPAWAGGAIAAKKRLQERILLEQQARQQMMMRQQQMQQEGQPGEERKEPAGVPEKQEQQPVVKDVVTPQQLIAALKTSAKSWPLIIDRPVKVMVVNYFIKEFAQKGITISKPASHYVSLIDGMAQQTPEMLNRPFSQVLEVVAIIEYDFGNGQNKDAMALKVLGSRQAVEADRKRLGL